MKQRFIKGVALSLTMALLLLCAPLSRAEIPRVNHQELLGTINSAKGKVAVVNFWATFCPPCRIEIPELVEVRRDYSEDDLYLLGVSMDMSEKVIESFLRQQPVNYPMVWATSDVASVFSVGAIPKIHVYDQQGGLVLKHEGYMQPDKLRKLVDELLESRK
ncbi:MAG: TlpA family protein disulfide reductase [Desulfovibrionales bacterium]